LLLAGAFTFAFLLGETCHELGHYVAHRALGQVGVRVHLDPFGGSHIFGVATRSPRVLGLTSAAGPLLNLALGICTMALLWRRLCPSALPLSLWGPVAMVQEGVTFTLGMLTPGGDAALIVAWGVPGPLLSAAGLALLCAGVATTSRLLSHTAFGRDDRFSTRLGIALLGFSPLMLLRSAHAFLRAPDAIVENLVPLAFSLLLAPLVALLHKPTREPVSPTGSAAAVALALAAGIFVLQVAASQLY
jgi:hypothetical protein